MTRLGNHDTVFAKSDTYLTLPEAAGAVAKPLLEINWLLAALKAALEVALYNLGKTILQDKIT